MTEPTNTGIWTPFTPLRVSTATPLPPIKPPNAKGTIKPMQKTGDAQADVARGIEEMPNALDHEFEGED